MSKSSWRLTDRLTPSFTDHFPRLTDIHGDLRCRIYHTLIPSPLSHPPAPFSIIRSSLPSPLWPIEKYTHPFSLLFITPSLPCLPYLPFFLLLYPIKCICFNFPLRCWYLWGHNYFKVTNEFFFLPMSRPSLTTLPFQNFISSRFPCFNPFSSSTFLDRFGLQYPGNMQ